MRVLHLIDSFGGSGGAEHGLLREAARFGSDVQQLVIRMFSKDALEERFREAGLATSSLDIEPRTPAIDWPVGVRRLSAQIEEFDPDVIHTSLFASNVVGQLAGRLKELPVLSTFTLSGDRSLLRDLQPGAGTLRASVLRRFAGVVARGNNVWFRALTFDAAETNASLLGVPMSRVRVIPRGVDYPTHPVSPPSRAELGIPADVRVLINIGRQTAQKGHSLLIEAFDAIRRQHQDVHLVICGREGDASGHLRQAIRERGLNALVTVTGYTPNVQQYLAISDVFVFSSLMEGLGTSVLEAFSQRVPVVAFDIPPVREVAGDAAELVPVGDAQALAVAVAGVLNDPGLAESLAGRGIERVAERFNIDHVARNVEQFLKDISGKST